MTLLDVNVLIYAHRPEMPQHAATLEWLTRSFTDGEPIAVWDVILTSTYRILSNPKLVREPEAAPRAMSFVQEVRAASMVLQPTPRYWTLLTRLLRDSRAVGNLVTDAAIAAFALDHDCKLATFDQDFTRFKGLRLLAPAIAPD